MKNKYTILLLSLFFLSNPSFAAEARGYDDLLTALRLEQSAPQDRVAASWKMGKLLEDDAEAHKLWAGYREEINKRLAADLGLRVDELPKLRQFARVYPEMPSRELGWEHYRILIYVHPAEKRKALEDQALREHWPKETLRLEVNRLHEAEKEIPKTENVFSKLPGKLNIYRVVKAQSGVNAGQKVLDLGFGLQKHLEENTPLAEGDFADENLKPVSASPEDLFTYQAQITKIQDGDTFEAEVDLGFGLSVTQTFRLNGVDAPELGSLRHGMSESRQQAPGSPETGEGITAKTFVYNEIMRTGGKVILRAGPPDKYNRILADVWIFAPAGVNAESLNQQLLDRKLAIPE